METFARRLETLRLERGMTQRTVAERANISTNHYLDIAHAQANPTIMVLLGLAKALNVSVADLFDPVQPAPDDSKHVLRVDLDDLVAAHKRLADAVARLVRNGKRPRARDTRRAPRA